MNKKLEERVEKVDKINLCECDNCKIEMQYVTQSNNFYDGYYQCPKCYVIKPTH